MIGADIQYRDQLHSKIAGLTPSFTSFMIWTWVIAMAFAHWSCVRSGELTNVNNSISDDFKRISEQNYSLLIPKGLVNENITVQDGFGERYSNRDLTVSIESGAGTSNLNYLKADNRVLYFQEIPLNRSDLIGSQANFEFKKGRTNFDDPDKPIVKMLSVDCRNVEKSVTFMILYSNRKYDEVASQILNSVTVSCSD